MLKFDGHYAFSHTRLDVWSALNDPEILQATIPGCKDLRCIEPGKFEADLQLKFGLLRFGTRGSLEVEVLEEAVSYRLHGSSERTMFGSGRGTASVRLADRVNGGTDLTYEVTAELDGRLASLGANLVSGRLHALGDRFFQRFEQAMIDAVEKPKPI